MEPRGATLVGQWKHSSLLIGYWLASGDLYLFRRLSEDLALASTVLVLRGAYLTQNLKYFDAILIKFLRMLNASKCKVFRFKIREKVFWANVKPTFWVGV